MWFYIDLGLDGQDDMMNAIRHRCAMAHLPRWAVDEIDRFDPTAGARWRTLLRRALAGRSIYGPRRAEWQALEDKMIVDFLWDAAGIERAPSMILPVEFDALWAAHQQFDMGLGSVWVGDNRDGWHGGAKLLRWVRSRDDGTAAQDFLSERSDRVRVMPFLDGIPCSIHGWVFADAVIGFRPCEMLVFRREGSDQLCYAGAATAGPSEATRLQMNPPSGRAHSTAGGLSRFIYLGWRGDGRWIFTDGAESSVRRCTRPNGEGDVGLPLYLLHVHMAGEELISGQRNCSPWFGTVPRPILRFEACI